MVADLYVITKNCHNKAHFLIMQKRQKHKRKHLMSNRLRPSVYNLFSPTDFLGIAAPINSNILTFTDKEIEEEYCRRLFQHPTLSQPSESFKGDLIYFYLYITLTSLTFISFAVLYKTEGLITTAHMIFHISYLSFALFMSFIILLCFFYVPKLVINSKCCMFCIGLVFYTYFIIAKESFLSKLCQDDSGTVDLPVTLGIISLTVVLKVMIFDSFLYTLLIVLYNLTFYLIINFSVEPPNRVRVFADFFVIFITLIFQLLESQALDLRSRLIFWLQVKNEQNLKTTASIFTKNEEGINSEPELLIKSCENVQKALKEACSVIIYKDINDSLKRSQVELENIKQRIGSCMFTSEIKIDNTLIDAEDKEFIHQNFIDLAYKSDKSSAGYVSLASHREGFYLFSDYGLEKLESMLSQFAQNWNFDIFFVKETTGKSLSVVGMFLFQKWDLTDFLKQSEEKVDLFFETLEDGYIENPYHNACHAAEVLHSDLYFFLHSFIKDYLSKIEMISCIVACLGHDIGHPAVTNRFLVNNRDRIAIKYNDASVLENLHASKTFKILTNPKSSILDNLPAEDWVHCRRLIIVMILETDMSKHFEILGKFRTRVQTLSNIDIENFEDKLQVLGMGIKCADIGHSSKELELHKRWTQLVCEEFFAQGDLEKSRGQSVSMYCDRVTTDISKSQAGFIRNICIPLYEVFSVFLHSDPFDRILSQLKSNLDYWSTHKKRRETVKFPQKEPKKLKRIKSNK